ncbi:hypothetical protein [Flavobacterium phragmitis]|uniref:hypothetical protein n=1 Tax=Flavobacterium phragmitis TaxID=739143 RepID=UPI000B8150D4|nr:hypothetical protein [Flavobacterium phragmitis]
MELLPKVPQKAKAILIDLPLPFCGRSMAQDILNKQKSSKIKTFATLGSIIIKKKDLQKGLIK